MKELINGAQPILFALYKNFQVLSGTWWSSETSDMNLKIFRYY